MAERFDWYQASFPGVDADEFLGQWMADHDMTSFRPAAGRHGYSHGGLVTLGDTEVLRMLFGGNADAPINVTASGAHTETLVKFARRRFPLHRVTRLDPCIDFEGAGAWSVLLDRTVDVKEAHRISSREAGDWLDGGVKGRTIYLGSPQSDVQFRLYEKGKQLGQGPDWVRAELQVRPKGITRDACAKATPAECWGFSRWSNDLRTRFGLAGVPRLNREVVQHSGLELRKRAMLKQYGATIRELLAIMGSPEALGVDLVASLEAIAAASAASPPPVDK